MRTYIYIDGFNFYYGAVQDLRKVIGVINPRGDKPTKALMKYADFYKKVRKGVLASSQLPDPILGTTIRKPKSW